MASITCSRCQKRYLKFHYLPSNGVIVTVVQRFAFLVSLVEVNASKYQPQCLNISPPYSFNLF